VALLETYPTRELFSEGKAHTQANLFRRQQRPQRGLNRDMELLTPDDVSKLTGVSTETLAQWRSQKKYIPYLKGGSLIRYTLKDMEAYLEQCRVSVSARRQK
jgi:hypothetical protein